MGILNSIFIIMATVLLFLFAVKKFSRQIENLDGDKFKTMLSSATSTPVRGIAAGAFVTAVIQSSTATTVMLVSLVNAGLISFYNSLGVIFGANIGTTITSQIVAFKVLFIAPYILIIGFLLERSGSKYKRYGKPLFYFGLIFMCILFINNLVAPFQHDQKILDFFANIDNIFYAILVGFLASVLLQSSSIASGIVIVLVGQGFLGFIQAMGLILGANIGTTSTAFIASLVMGVSAKKTALAHFLFNLLGVLLFLPLIGVFSSFVQSFGFAADKEVALAHFSFNLFATIIFLIFINPFYRLVDRVYKKVCVKNICEIS